MHVNIAENLNWVGFTDWNVRDFHGYETRRGTTYNAYLVGGTDSLVLMDTVKAEYAGELLKHIREMADPAAITHIVSQHAEPDHAGALPTIMAACPNAELVCNPKGCKTLAQHMDMSGWKVREVRGGEALDLGGRSLHFIDTPLAHWPESMATWCPEEQILFSMDAFGQHYAGSGRFDDQEPFEALMLEARSYYANILLPYGKPVRKVLDALKALDIRLIAPSHGVIWRSHIADILSAYANWAAGIVRPKVMVVYDTMWKSTEHMARAIQGGASETGVQALLLHLRQWPMADLTSEMLDTAALAVGSPTLNNTLMPQAAALLTYWYGLSPADKKSFAFGSSGWGKQGPEAVQKYLADMGFSTLRDPLHARYVPTTEIIEECRQAGIALGQAALEAQTAST